VALARALVMDPPLLLLDEPTAGLDPDAADAFCNLLRSLHEELRLSVVMVTHDLDTIYAVSSRIAVIADKHVIVEGTPRNVIDFPHPFVRDFFRGGRGHRAMEVLQNEVQSE
jgi:phospholipid/cholesterol/gamma-HCH transport system ATP-binding protein